LSTTIDSWKQILSNQKAIAVIRSPQIEIGFAMAQAVAKGGMKLIEITWNSEKPTELISQLRANLPDCLIGTGTILDRGQLLDAIACGSQFVFSPHLDTHLINIAINDYNIPFIPGTFSPTEIVTAWQAGATAIKVFPIHVLGGAEYIKSLQAPLGNIPLIPTGGITLENAPAMIAAGAIAVGLSSQLFPQDIVKEGDWQKITQRTQTLLTSLKKI
jgi:2-dehydro-3-deoxyphosphogluconate aldolase/(4S)-4-hydroxy-2-oxoglutarate aldolase